MMFMQTPKSRRRWTLACFVVLLVLVVTLDLKLSGMKTVEVESLTLDATQSLPHASADFVIEHGSRFSSVEPKSAQCATESGEILVDIAPHNNLKNGYTVNVTCDENFVEPHADLIWNVILGKQSSLSFACWVNVRVHVLHLIPFTQAIFLSSAGTVSVQPEHGQDNNDDSLPSAMESTASTMPSEFYPVASNDDHNEERGQETPQKQEEGEQKDSTYTSSPPTQGKDDEQGQEYEQGNVAEEENQQPNNRPVGSSFSPEYSSAQAYFDDINRTPNWQDQTHNQDDFSSNSHPPSLQVRQVSINRLDLCVRLELPKSTHQLVPKDLRVKLPRLIIHAQPNGDEQVGGVLWMDPFDERFSLVPVHESMTGSKEEDKYVLFGFACETTDCPWFRPVMDLFLNSAAYGTSMIHVTVKGNGSFMEVLLGRQHNFYVQTEHKYLSNSRRHLATSTTREEAEANCLRLDDDNGDFDFSLCWLLEPSDGFVLVGAMSLFDFAMDGFAEMGWEIGGDAVKMNMNALVEMGDSNEMMDMNGELLVDWQDDLVVNMSAINQGSWFPFAMEFFSEGRTVGDVFSMALKSANFIVDGDGIVTDATGGVIWNFDEQTFEASLRDPDIQASLLGELLEDQLRSTSSIVRDGVTRWNSTFDGRIFESDYDVGNLLVKITETTNHYSISVGGTLDRDSRSLEAHVDDANLKINLYGQVLEEEEEAFVGAFGISFEGEDLFLAKWDGRLEPTQDDSVKVAMSLQETKSDFSMSGGVSASNVNDIFNIEVEYFILQLRQTKHVDMSATLVIDAGLSTVEMYMNDVGSLDFVAKMGGTWCTECSSSISLQIKNGIVSRGQETILEVESAGFQDNDGVGLITLKSKDNAKLKLTFDIDYAVAEAPRGFSANLNQLAVDWEDESLANIDGFVSLDLDGALLEFVMEDPTVLDTEAKFVARWSPDDGSIGGYLDKVLFKVDTDLFVDLNANFLIGGDGTSIDFFAEDSGNSDFEMSLKSYWQSDTSSWSFNMEDALFRAGSRTFFHCSGDFGLDDRTDIGLVDFESTPESELKMIMETQIVWYDDDAVMMTVDRMFLGWQDTVYINAGVNPNPYGTATAAPAPAPFTEESHNFAFSGIYMRLEGAPQLTEESRAAFERATEAFYESVYQPIGIRRLQDGAVTNFNTKVTATDEDYDALGNTITYDQTISFTTNRPYVNQDVALVLLTGPLLSEQSQDEFMEVLREEDEVFSSVTGVSPPDTAQESSNKGPPSGDNSPSPDPSKNAPAGDYDGIMLPLILAIVGGFVFCCCCGGGIYYAKNKGLLFSGNGGGHLDNAEGYPLELEKEQHDAPEAHPETSFHDESVGRNHTEEDGNEDEYSYDM